MKKDNSIAQVTMLLPKSKFEELNLLAKEMNCEDITGLFSKSLELAKLFIETKKRNFKMIACDRLRMTEVISEKNERVIVICESEDSYIDIEESIDEIMEFNAHILKASGWGFPTEIFEA